jgi:Domain of unknown function (DUF4188)
MAAKRGTDRGRRDPNPEVRQFALAGQVAPGGVLAGQVDNPAVGFPGPAVAGPSGGAGRSRRRRTMRRCQPSRVSGCTNKHDQRELGSTRLTGSIRARSAGSSLGGGSWRRRTVRWWPSTRSSRSVAPSPRATRLSSWIERHSVREARFDTTRDGFPRIDTGRSRPSCRPTRISRSQAAFEYPYPSRSCCNPHATSATNHPNPETMSSRERNSSSPTVRTGRWMARRDEPFAVFVFGMRLNRLRGLPRFLWGLWVLRRVLGDLNAHPEHGYLTGRVYPAGRTLVAVQYWESFDALDAWARDHRLPIASRGSSTCGRRSTTERWACGMRPTWPAPAAGKGSTATCRRGAWPPAWRRSRCRRPRARPGSACASSASAPAEQQPPSSRRPDPVPVRPDLPRALRHQSPTASVLYGRFPIDQVDQASIDPLRRDRDCVVRLGRLPRISGECEAAGDPRRCLGPELTRRLIDQNKGPYERDRRLRVPRRGDLAPLVHRGIRVATVEA